MEKYTAEAMVRHWDWARQKGLMNSSTAQSIASGCRGVLEAQENWEELDIRTLNVEQSVQIFKNLRANRFAPRSLRDYEQRFRRAVESYKRYLEDPASWSFPSRSSKSRTPTPVEEKARKGLKSAGESVDGGEEKPGDHVLHEYRYPFRPDIMAKLEIPRDATTAEINRLVGWALTLAVDYDPSS